MTRYETFRKGGTKDEPIVTFAEPDESYIVDVLKATDKTRMPPPPKDSGDPLPPQKIAVIERWIAGGLAWSTWADAQSRTCFEAAAAAGSRRPRPRPTSSRPRSPPWRLPPTASASSSADTMS